MSVRKVHKLKTWPAPFSEVWAGNKCHEIRKFDRDFMVGDGVILREFEPDTNQFTGRFVSGKITYISAPGEWGLPETIGVFSVRIFERIRKKPAPGDGAGKEGR